MSNPTFTITDPELIKRYAHLAGTDRVAFIPEAGGRTRSIEIIRVTDEGLVARDVGAKWVSA